MLFRGNRRFQGLTNLRSVTWTKVSLKEAKIRATPKTSSPVKMEGFVSSHKFTRAGHCDGWTRGDWLTLADLRSEGDVLLRRARGLSLGRHVELDCWWTGSLTVNAC